MNAAPSGDLIEAHRTWMIAGGFSPLTVDGARTILFRVDRDLREIQPAHVGLAGAYPEELAKWLAGDGNWSAQTRANYRDILVRFYRWACDEDDPWLSYDPSTRLRRPKIRRRIPDPAGAEQVAAIFARATQPWWLHCLLAAKVGLRPIEIAAARREDFTPAHVRIPHGKGDKPAVLPLDDQVWEVIEVWPPGPVTGMVCGRPATAHWVSDSTRQYLHRELGIATSLKRLRHFYATWLLDHGATMREVQELMRHESIETTAGYTAVSGGRLRAAVGTLPRFDVPAWVAPGVRSGGAHRPQSPP